ncbi:MAG: DUF6049 family protein [Egibacteraceae bacterium]
MTRLAAAVLALCAALLAAPPHGTAQAAAPDPEFGVLELDGVLTGPESVLRVLLWVRNPGPDLRVTGALHRRTGSRFAFHRAMDDGQAGQVTRELDPVPVSPLPAGASSTVELRATAAELGIDGEAAQGVYPLTLRIQRGGAEPETIGEVTTSVVAATTPVGNPLRLAMLVPIDHAPGMLADGSYDERLTRALAPGGVLDRIARELEAEAHAPLTVAPSGYLLEQAADMADGYQRAGGAGEVTADASPARDAAAFLGRIQQVTGRAGVEEIAPAYGPADLVALVRSGLGVQARRELSEGVSAVERVTGHQALRGVLMPAGGLDRATLAVAREESVDTVVLDEASVRLRGRADLTSPPPVRRLDSGETALVTDPFLDDVLASATSAPDADRVLTAQRVVAETAVVYFERPFAAAARGLLVSTPRRWEPAPGLLAELLARTRSAPWLRPVDLTGLRRGVEASQRVGLAYPSALQRRELSPRYLAGLTEARAALGSLVAVLSPDDPMASRLDRMLLAAAAVWYRDGEFPSDGAARIAEVHRTQLRVYASVHVVEDYPVTLTSIEDQQVPVTLVSEADVRLRIRVRLEAMPIAFEQGNPRIVDLEPGLPTTLVFPVRVLTPGGTFAANVYVEDPSGTRRLAHGSIQVRSAVYSIVALVLTAGAGLFLVAWWAREVVRLRDDG